MKLVIDASTGESTQIEMSPEEIAEQTQRLTALAWQELRLERNRRLVDSDWTVLSDTPTNTAAWKTYRQALRDLPANTTDPYNPVWPTPPA